MIRDAEALRRVGEALYGGSFYGQLALDLDVGVRSLQRWAGGQAPIPFGIWPELATLCRERRLAIARIERQLRGSA